MDQSAEFLRQHLIDPELCARCNSCEEACTRSAISHDGENYAVDPERCAECGDCMKGCSTGAIDSWRMVQRDTPYSIVTQLSWSRLPDALAQPAGSATTFVPLELTTQPQRPRAPASAAHPAAHHYTWDSPAQALIRSNEAVTRAADGAEVRHIVLEFAAGEFPVLEGQSIGIVPPGRDELGRKHHVRLYSVASARDGEGPGTNTVALTVKRVLQDHNGKGVRGVCSNYLCDLSVGASADVTGPVGDTFLMPDDPGIPLLMVCTGTGVAPMRAMIQRRLRLGHAKRDDLMLIYGGRSPHELPYLKEFESYRGERLDLNIGYSRMAGTPRTYVQDLLLERRGDVAHLIRDRGACVYLCGLQAMELGVQQALAEILGMTGQDWEQFSRQLAASGRFHVEVY